MSNVYISNRLVKGDEEVIDEIYSLYHKKIFNFAFSILKDEDAALDIIQETFIKLWEQRKSLKKDANLKAYIYTIAKNAVLSTFRKHATEEKYLDYLKGKTLSNSSGSEEMTEYKFLEEQYEVLLQQLPEKRREIFVLSRKQGLSNKEIAEHKGISIKTVEAQISKALTFFKANIDLCGIFWGLFSSLFID